MPSVITENTMKKTTYSQVKQQPFITSQDIIYVLILIAISLAFSLIPVRGFGQQLPPGNIPNDGFSTLDSAIPSTPVAPVNSKPIPTSPAPAIMDIPALPAAPANPNVEHSYTPRTESEFPAPSAAALAPTTANQYQSPLLRNPQVEIASTTEHPFRQYWGVPSGPQTKIIGKPMTVAELFAGTRSSVIRCQLLQTYWELSGLLAIYHFRCEAESLPGAQQQGMLTLLREQRRTAEVEFIKQQWVLAELLKQYKGRTLLESELPIPADFPLYPRYQTFADKIARSERTQYLGRMIPLQEQLIESKNGLWKAASEMAQSVSQPLVVVSNQRATAFLDLTKAIIEYNKMIAEYAMETIPPNVSQKQLVAAVVRQNTTQPPSPMTATGGITLTQYFVLR
jgi:hypothetical protein